MISQRHQGEQFPAHIRNAARRLLVVDRFSSSTAVQRLSELFPAERIPNDSTLRVWRSQFPEITNEESALIEQNERQAILSADTVILDTLNYAKDLDPSINYKNLMALNAIQGTYRDKQLRRQESRMPTQSSPQLVIVLGNQPLTITSTDPSAEEPPTIEATRDTQ